MYRLRTMNSIMSEMPFEVLITLLCLLTGLPMALGILPPPNSLLRTLPDWSIRSWGALLTIGGILTLVGLLLSHATKKRRYIEGLYVESGGMLVLGTGTLVYGLAIFAAAGWHAIFSVLIYFAMTASCLFRFRTARQLIKKMRQAIGFERKRSHGT